MIPILSEGTLTFNDTLLLTSPQSPTFVLKNRGRRRFGDQKLPSEVLSLQGDQVTDANILLKLELLGSFVLGTAHRQQRGKQQL
jgi:hypothetical protein